MKDDTICRICGKHAHRLHPSGLPAASVHLLSTLASWVERRTRFKNAACQHGAWQLPGLTVEHLGLLAVVSAWPLLSGCVPWYRGGPLEFGHVTGSGGRAG